MAEKENKPRAKKSPQTKEEIMRADLFILKSEREMITAAQKKSFKDDGPLRMCEVIRVGIHALSKLPEKQLQEIVDSLIRLKQR
jgi:hypothetical protein